MPLVRAIMAIELLIESEKALEVAPLGLERRPGLAGHLGEEVDARQVFQTLLGPRRERKNVMLKIIVGNERVFGQRILPS